MAIFFNILHGKKVMGVLMKKGLLVKPAISYHKTTVKLTFFCHCGLDSQSSSVKCINQGIAARRPQ
jgi:hypothetical protein